VRTLIAGDWHLGTYSAATHASLAGGFLERARQEGDLVVLNGDIFEGLFEPVARAEAAHPGLAALIATMAGAGRIARTEGNHDPGAGVHQLILEHDAVGRILVAHGHRVDPMHGSSAGHLGDRISRRFGHRAVVRGAARAVETVVTGVAATHVDRFFRRKCRALVEGHRCDLGVFGHNHRQYLVPGDRYANAGCLKDASLEYLLLDEAGPRLCRFGLDDLGADAPAIP